MQFIATFDHSSYLEIVIKKLENQGVHEIFAIPLDNRKVTPKLFDSIHQSDGVSLINKGMFLAVVFSVIAASRGFILEWGPIIWGLIGAGGGFSLGFAIDWLKYKTKNKNQNLPKGKRSEVILVIECQREKANVVEDILWECLAFGVAKIDVEE